MLKKRIGYLGCGVHLFGWILAFIGFYQLFNKGIGSYLGWTILGVLLLIIGAIMMITAWIKRANEKAEDREAERIVRIAKKVEEKFQEEENRLIE